MKRTLTIFAAAIAMSSLAASAGTISGKVGGVTGESVVYVDAIAGKTFPAPKDHPVIDQKGLMFTPHIMAVQQGTTVEFLNSDNGAAQRLLDCDRRRQEARTQSGHVAQG